MSISVNGSTVMDSVILLPCRVFRQVLDSYCAVVCAFYKFWQLFIKWRCSLFAIFFCFDLVDLVRGSSFLIFHSPAKCLCTPTYWLWLDKYSNGEIWNPTQSGNVAYGRLPEWGEYCQDHQEYVTRRLSTKIALLLKETCDQRSGQEFNLSCSRNSPN